MNTQENIWKKLHGSPFVALAPMDDVTDVVFRRLVHELAPADVYFTEFASVEGFCSPGRQAIERRLRLHPDEGPVIAQIWGTTPEYFHEMAESWPSVDLRALILIWAAQCAISLKTEVAQPLLIHQS